MKVGSYDWPARQNQNRVSFGRIRSAFASDNHEAWRRTALRMRGLRPLRLSTFTTRTSIKAQRSHFHSTPAGRLLFIPSATRFAFTPVPSRYDPRAHSLKMSTTTVTTRLTPSQAAAAALATIDLKGYDAEQARLMDERCILVDEEDRPLGAADKKTCAHPLSAIL